MHNCAEGFWIPKGREGWSWSRVVGELQQILAFLEEKEWQLVSKVPFSKWQQIRSLLHDSATLGGPR
jgi:hypothetical protein